MKLYYNNIYTNLIQIYEHTTNNVVGEVSRDPLVSITSEGSKSSTHCLSDTNRFNIKTNQMDLIKTRNKEKCKSYYILYIGLKIGVM